MCAAAPSASARMPPNTRSPISPATCCRSATTCTARWKRSRPAALAADEALRNLHEGVSATERQLDAALERQQVKRIWPMGEKFDANLHQAMFEVPTADQAPGTVVQVMQAGYLIHDRLLRPALVGVAKQPAGEAPPPARARSIRSLSALRARSSPQAVDTSASRRRRLGTCGIRECACNGSVCPREDPWMAKAQALP